MDLRISFKVFRRLSPQGQQGCIFGLRHFIVSSRGLPVELREYIQCGPSSHTRNCSLRRCHRRSRRTRCCAKSLPPAAVRRQPASCWRAKDEPPQTRQGVLCVVCMRQISTNLTATCRACSWARVESMLSVQNSQTIFTANTCANYAHENGPHLVRPDSSRPQRKSHSPKEQFGTWKLPASIPKEDPRVERMRSMTNSTSCRSNAAPSHTGCLFG
jgi:hypothetical protein